ncbi:MAG: DUF2125 domain-containing protein [Alphaproteobacteria bacterium]|nr:DUF2125 domain-containing protein [Alphaproteobacteria bacterium]
MSTTVSTDIIARRAERRRARISFWLFALFLAAVSAATASWFVGADLVRDRIAKIASEAAAGGGSFSTSAVKVTGFPLTFNAEVSKVRITGRTPRGVWEWQADRIQARLAPWRAGGATFDLAGNHKLRFTVGRQPLDLDITAGTAPGEFIAAQNEAPRIFKVAPQKLVIRETVTGQRFDAEKASVQLFRFLRAKTAASETSAGIILELNDVTLPKEADKVLGSKLAHFQLEAQVMGDTPLPLERPRLARWRRDGGVLEIKKIDLAWGPAKLSGNGTLSLDDSLQPEASLAARITGHEKTVDALVAAGMVRENVARGVKLVLDMMARRTSPGSEAVIQLPLSIQSRVIYVGPARLARLPQIRW